MPLAQPNKLREKILLIASGKQGKTTCWLSIAYWSFKSGDTRKFYVIDTEEAVEAVLMEAKYDGMIYSVNGEVIDEGGNIVLFNVTEWDDYMDAQGKIMADAVQGDWIVLDMISHAWPAVQTYWLEQASGKTRGESLLGAAKAGKKGWDMFKIDYDWTVINALYDDFLKPILIRSRAHVFMCAEQDEIRESNNMPQDQKEHIKDFGKYKAVGQKKLPYQCRSYLRLQRLARGRVLHTLGDRAREEMSNEDMSDFFNTYLVKRAGWKMEAKAREEAPSNA